MSYDDLETLETAKDLLLEAYDLLAGIESAREIAAAIRIRIDDNHGYLAKPETVQDLIDAAE